jgi:hypothetical protein
MKPLNDTARSIVAVIVIVVLAGAFWLVLLSPKREKSSELSKQEKAVAATVTTEQARAEAGEAAKKAFPQDYRQLVLLGKAVPAEADTPSLLVQLNGLGNDSNAIFKSIGLSSGTGESEELTTEGATSASALPPLGASVGPAGLLKMPYELEYEGGFFNVAHFLEKLDSMVQTNGNEVAAKGRLIVVDGFGLTPLSGEEGGRTSSSKLAASISVSTYVTPPGQGVTAGATATGPAESSPDLP